MPCYKDRQANTWYCKFYYTDYEGKRRQKWKGGFALKRDAEAYESGFLNSVAFTPSMPFGAFLDLYRNDVDGRLREHSIIAREYRIGNHIVDSFGDMKLNDIDALDIRRWQNELLEKGLANYTLKGIQSTLSAVFNHAVKFYGLKTNPCKTAGILTSTDETKEPMPFWTYEQYSAVIAEVDDLKAQTAIALLYWSGMRKGELLALRWNKIDFEAGTCEISQSYQRIGGEAVVTATKTGDRRTILLPDVCLDQLSTYRNALYRPDPDDYVFDWEKRFIEKGIAEGAGRAGVKRIHVHGLRHSHASLLISLGANIVLISKRLGHAKVSTTLDTYSHFFPDDEKKTVMDLDDLASSEK